MIPRLRHAMKHPFETFTLGTWNIQVAGTKKTKDKASMDIIAQVITNFDILAIQEVTNENFFHDLTSRIRRNHNMNYSYITHETGDGRENNSFLFKTRNASLNKIVKTGGEKISLYPQGESFEKYYRPPSCSVFSAGHWMGGLVNLHAYFSDPLPEIKGLNKVIPYFQKITGIENVLPLGDFNTNDVLQSFGLASPQFFPGRKADTTTYGLERNAIDWIIYSKEYNDLKDARVLSFGLQEKRWFYDKLPEDDLKEISQKVSDHWPIKLEFYKWWCLPMSGNYTMEEKLLISLYRNLIRPSRDAKEFYRVAPTRST